MKRRTVTNALAASLCMTALSSTVKAGSAPPSPDGPLGTLMQVSIVDRNTGRTLPVYRHGGEYWIAGRPGARYAIRVRNTQSERLMSVMSVDGVNVLSGETAATDQIGYVLGSGKRADITGWRKSDSQIAAFEFTSLGNSYATRTGRPDHVGVIGVATFRERAVLVEPQAQVDSSAFRRSAPAGNAARERRAEAPAAESSVRKDSAEVASQSMAPALPAPSLGTGHGRRETSHVSHTMFERLQSVPDDVVLIRYDSRENLIAAGIIPAPTARRPAATPSAFPGSDTGYVPDPPPQY